MKATSLGQMVELGVPVSRALAKVVQTIDGEEVQLIIQEPSQRTMFGEMIEKAMTVAFGDAFAKFKILRGHVVNCDVDPFVPQGWDLMGEGAGHRKGGRVKLERRGEDLYANSKKIELFFADGQSKGIRGHNLRKVLVEKPVLNANILDYLLKPENQYLIPENWKEKYVFFWGTIYRDSNGNLYVRCLYWDGGGWGRDYRWLGGGFDDNFPAAVSAS